MKKKVVLENRADVWDAKKRYKVNQSVIFNGFSYQNITGGNSSPDLLTDWVAVSDEAIEFTSQLTNDGDGLSPFATDDNVVHKSGVESVSGVKTFVDLINFLNGISASRTTNLSLPIIELSNYDGPNRTTKLRFSNNSASFDLGMEDEVGTLFQLKYAGTIAYFNIDRFTGRMALGYGAQTPYATLSVKDGAASGNTRLVVQAGIGQTSDLIETRSNSNQQLFRVDKDGNIKYYKNLNKLIVISGDSFSNDISGAGGVGDFPQYFLFNQENHDWQHVVTAVAGRTVATMLANYATEITPYARTQEHQERMLMLYGGINDMSFGRSAVDVYNDLKSMWSNAKAEGFKIIAFRICSATGLTAPQEAQRVALNDLISSDTSLYDYLVYADVLFPNPADTSFFSDGTHLNLVGAQYLGEHVLDVVYGNKFSKVAINSIALGYEEKLQTKSSIEVKNIKANGAGEFTGKVSGANATASNEFITLGQLTIVNTTTTDLSLSTLNATYPTAIPGFEVHCMDIISGGPTIYKKTASGWVILRVILVT